MNPAGLHNERVKYVRSLTRVHQRQRDRSFVIEGVRLVEEALLAGIGPSVVLVAEDILGRTPRGSQLLDLLRPFHPLPVTDKTLAAVCDTVTPQGVVAVVPIPALNALDPSQPLVVVLDNLADPGNVGTILRTAWACGVVGAVVALGGVDLFSPKVVRAAAGAHFHLQLLSLDRWSEVQALLTGRCLFVAVAADGTPYYQARWQAPAALVIGSEANGVCPEILAVADVPVHIPMPGGAESINAAVAAGILMFEAARHLTSN